MSTEFFNSAERIKVLRETLGAISQADLAKQLGIPRHKIADIEFGKVKISVELAEMLEEKFNINFRWALTGKGNVFQTKDEIETQQCLSPEEFVIVPLLEGWVAAGPAGEIIYGDIADHYPFKRWWIERLIGKRPERLKELFLIKVRGNSMSPTINQGEVILVDTNESERLTIRTGHVYVVVMPDGSVVLKRLAFSERAGGMRLICISDNLSEFKPFDFELEYGKSILEYVLGRVRWAGKEFD